MPTSPDLLWTYDWEGGLIWGRENTHDDAVSENTVDGMNDDLGHIWWLRDIREESSGSSGFIYVLDEAPDQSSEAKGDVDGREAEHEYGDGEDDRGNFSCASKTDDVDIGREYTDVDACTNSSGMVSAMSITLNKYIAHHKREFRARWLQGRLCPGVFGRRP